MGIKINSAVFSGGRVPISKVWWAEFQTDAGAIAPRGPWESRHVRPWWRPPQPVCQSGPQATLLRKHVFGALSIRAVSGWFQTTVWMSKRDLRNKVLDSKTTTWKLWLSLSYFFYTVLEKVKNRNTILGLTGL